jgi:perosamine synthetase
MRFPSITLPHLTAQLWGTTTLQDCIVALGFGINHRHLIQGPQIQEYEDEFAKKVGVRFAVSFSTGRVALYALLNVFNVHNGDEVLLQVPTHIVVPNSIRFAGGRPVYVDCDPTTFNIDLEDAERKITPRTRILLVQHTFGIPVDIHAAQCLAEKYNLTLIEDCVHALGAQYLGQQLGSFGRAAFFSTEETKVISSTMGGMAVTNDPTIAAQLRVFQQGCAWPDGEIVWRYLAKLILYHIFTQPYIHPYTRWIYLRVLKRSVSNLAPSDTSVEEMEGRRPGDYLQRLSNGQAAIALRQIKRLDANISHRRSMAYTYHKLLQERGSQVIRLPSGSQPSFVRYPLIVSDRVLAIQAASQRVILGEWFSSVLEGSASPAFGEYEAGSCPNAEYAVRHLVNLPTHFRVKLEDADYIISLLQPYLTKEPS